jgi:LmbE family N-acetylglucosaminyl deacetylase
MEAPMPVAMVISPHADDAAAFCGATLAKFARQGWHMILVRVTDDRKDSLELSIEETIQRNTAELHEAARILGISEIVELNYETDCLADVSLVDLRERFVFLIRKYRPYALFSFDPYGLYENNQDHIRVAQAVDEALWVACFDKHHPEHFEEGLEPFSVCERWYFARQLRDPNHAEDISEFLEAKIEALCAHREMMQNTMNQYVLQLRTWGRRMPWLEQSIDGDLKPLIALVMQEQANAVAAQFELGEGRMGEAFRLERFGDLEPLFQEMSVPIKESEPPTEGFRPSGTTEHNSIILRPGLDQTTHESPWSEEQLEHIFPVNLNEKISLMGHHHLCAGAFQQLLDFPAFQLGYANLVEHLKPSPDVIIESIYGYDLFCYQCGYWSEEEGRCSTGWKNKITKDAAVLEHLGLRTGDLTRLEHLQRLLAERVTYDDLERFCGPGDWKCEFYALGICQSAYTDLRHKFGIETSGIIG